MSYNIQIMNPQNPEPPKPQGPMVTPNPQNPPQSLDGVQSVFNPSGKVPTNSQTGNYRLPPQKPQDPKRKKDDVKSFLYTVILFIIAIAAAFFMIVYVFQSYIVDGSSMEPTLQNGNRVFVLKLPKSIANLQGKEFTPARGEVIIFKKPTTEGTQLIKRVIGIPGDRVTLQNGELKIYNSEHPNGYNPDLGTDYGDSLQPIDQEGDIIDVNVKEGQLFVMGDNRTAGGSFDSHTGLGLVPVENIVGRLWIRYFPLSEFQVFANTFTAVTL